MRARRQQAGKVIGENGLHAPDVGHDRRCGPRGEKLSLFRQLPGQDAGDGAGDPAVLPLLFHLGDPGVRAGEPGAGGVDFLRPGAGAQLPEPLLRGAERRFGHVPPGDGVVPGLGGPRPFVQEPLHPLHVPLGPGQVRRGPGRVGLGLGNLLGAAAGQAQAQVGGGLIPVGAGRVQGQPDVHRVDPGQFLAGAHEVPLLEREAFQSPRHFRGDPDVGGLHVPGGDDEGRVPPVAAPEEKDPKSGDGGERSRSPHVMSFS